jgi:FKBP-type peptidyl-prolyl cis-trans isomerase SlyD
MMDVAKDTFVVLEYTVQLEDGSFVKGEDGPVSLNFVVGYGQVLPALEQILLGLEAGTQKEFVIPAQRAFGPRDPSQVRTRTFEEFPEGKKLQVGKWVIATNARTEAQYSYFVADKTEDSVTLDFNHPLAGKDLYYRLKIVHVRPALEEELDYLEPCKRAEESEDGAQ